MRMFAESTTPKWCEIYLICNQINYKDMKIVINGKIPMVIRQILDICLMIKYKIKYIW